eukprot:COSAG01_NODE_20260_length_963_cov_1.010417_2_plen_111_part_00
MFHNSCVCLCVCLSIVMCAAQVRMSLAHHLDRARDAIGQNPHSISKANRLKAACGFNATELLGLLGATLIRCVDAMRESAGVQVREGPVFFPFFCFAFLSAFIPGSGSQS